MVPFFVINFILIFTFTDGDTCPATGISFLPHLSDCTKFFECINGNKEVMHCPDQYAWSTRLNQCVDQSEADCSCK